MSHRRAPGPRLDRSRGDGHELRRTVRRGERQQGLGERAPPGQRWRNTSGVESGVEDDTATRHVRRGRRGASGARLMPGDPGPRRWCGVRRRWPWPAKPAGLTRSGQATAVCRSPAPPVQPMARASARTSARSACSSQTAHRPPGIEQEAAHRGIEVEIGCPPSRLPKLRHDLLNRNPRRYHPAGCSARTSQVTSFARRACCRTSKGVKDYCDSHHSLPVQHRNVATSASSTFLPAVMHV